MDLMNILKSCPVLSFIAIVLISTFLTSLSVNPEAGAAVFVIEVMLSLIGTITMMFVSLLTSKS